MKTKLLISVLLISIVTNVLYAQSSKFEVGLQGGPSVIFLRGSNLPDKSKPTVGYSVGPSFQYHFTDVISFKTGIYYEQKGNASDLSLADINGGSAGTANVNHNLGYLVLPILAQFQLNTRVKPFLNAGPYIGYLVSETDVSSNAANNVTFSLNNVNSSARVDFGIATGLGVVFPLYSNLTGSIEARNNWGLYNTYNTTSYQDRYLYTNSINLLFGIHYQFGN